jgi:sugar lactone lactonase YvrE
MISRSDRSQQSRGLAAQTLPTILVRRFFAGAVLFSAGAFAPLSLAASASQIVASRLNNPRGLDFAPNGALYVAEAGRGGTGTAIPAGGGGELKFGLSGSVTRVFNGEQQRIVGGLPSLANAEGGQAIGPSDISFGHMGNAVLTIGLGQNPSVRDDVLKAPAAAMGTLWQLNQNGKMKIIADLAKFEIGDPDGNGPDSNPNGVLNDQGGSVYATDAGGNTLLQIGPTGAISVVAVFPNRMVQSPFPPFGQMPMQAVPTNVVRGPDGAFYVSQLTGFPFPPGGALVYRVVPGTPPQVYADGFTNIIDLEFDSTGNLYVLEIDADGLRGPNLAGRLVLVGPGGQNVVTIAQEGLVMPGGMTIGPDGAIYVSNFSTSPGTGPVTGQVVRIQP